MSVLDYVESCVLVGKHKWVGQLEGTDYLFHAQSYSIQHVLVARVLLRETRTSSRVESC